MTLHVTDGRFSRRAAARVVAGAAGVAVAAAGAGIQAQAAEPSDVAASDDFQITADGYYATARVEVADNLPLPLPLPLPKTDASLTVGQIESEANSAGIEGEDEGVHSRAFGTIASVEGAGADFDVPYMVEQVALPEEDETATYGFHDVEVPIVGSLDAISGEVKANWNNDLITQDAEGGTLTSLYSGVGQLDVLDATALGPVSSLLPIDSLPGGHVISIGAGQLEQETGTFANGDGTLGGYAEVRGRFGDVSILGGAENGGISLGFAGSDDGDEPNSWGRLEATGEPGGASFDYELPAIELHVGDDEVIDVEPGFDQTFDINGVAVNLNFADYRDDDTVLAEDGTVAAASGGGLALKVTMSAPLPMVGDVEVASAEIGLLSFPELSVEVPQGGIAEPKLVQH